MLNQHKILRVLQLISFLQKEPAKSIRFMSSFIESTERTVYRYLDLIKELGFELERDQNKRYLIKGGLYDGEEAFTNEEVTLLKELLLSTAKDNKLKDSLLKKIYFKSEIAVQGNHILNAHLGKIVQKISLAIQQENKVILKSYHSANSQKIDDRLVEPIAFTDNYTSICAFEVVTQENKYFNVERITDVEQLDVKQEFKDLHKVDSVDVFGFTEYNGEKFDIQLRLSLRAYVILKEEYPRIIPFIKQETNKSSYLLTCSINNPKPITRFILGLSNEVDILGSEEFLKHIEKRN
ncbi:MAG: WYL domain-containing protein [Flavobacterium sp.]|uniref:helix-turn-helix transcriptional regulator n=1 Tax=Flavobacterium sp. TaxID=239 RepID=UPI0022BB57A8|nr:WYL domain-containing protein [Flavobacterium sp.]MCZ8296998.1 WYL domain-containing protein [Flavobacterium sp.]